MQLASRISGAPMDGEIPKQAPHFFTEVDMSLFREPDYRSFEEVSQLARANGNVHLYAGLREAVRKFAWSTLAARQLIGISRYFASHDGEHAEGKVYNDFSAHSEYERNLTEFSSYAKATLDTLAHFLNSFFQLKEKNQSADFKWVKFRERVAHSVPDAAAFFAANAEWLDKDAARTTSVFSTRDEWVHREAPIISRHFPAQGSGPLPIPRTLKLAKEQAPEQDELWTVEAFTDYHLSRLHQLLQLCVRAAIASERLKSPDLAIDRMPGPATFFPLRLTVGMTLKSMVMRFP